MAFRQIYGACILYPCNASLKTICISSGQLTVFLARVYAQSM